MYKQIAVKDFESFEDHQFLVGSEGDTMIGNAVFLMRGKKWRDMRNTLSPVFTGSKMRHMFELIRECVDDSCNFYVNKLKKDSIEVLTMQVKDFYSRYANDVIASCAFGLKINSHVDRNNQFYTTGLCLRYLSSMKTFIKIIIIRCFPWLAKSLDIQILSKNVRKIFSDLVLGNMNERERKKIFRPDLIDLLMRARRRSISNDGNMKVWSDQDMISQCFVFFLAGYDTITWFALVTTYELARRPDLQQRLIDEIDETDQQLYGGVVTFDILKNMKYLDMVISEILRLWSPGVYIDRICTRRYRIQNDGKPDVIIEKGTEVWIPIFSFHHDPRYFPNPDQFDPERFNPDNKSTVKYYFPFGIGPRQCIANRFALMETKLIIFYMLKMFRFEVIPETEVPMELSSTPFGIRPKREVKLGIRLRQKNNEP